MTIDQKTMAEILQLGGQYLLPVAALLRALYSGLRGKFPEGFSQIAVASLFAGISAAVGNEQLDIRSVMLAILGNTAFMVGLLSFIMIYLLRQPDRGQVVDGVVGGIIGFIAWLAWVYLLGNEWPWWTAPLVIIAGAAAFIVLRILLRQIAKLVKIATYFIVLGIILVVAGGGILLLQTLTQAA
jgi:hypothetical protein